MTMTLYTVTTTESIFLEAQHSVNERVKYEHEEDWRETNSINTLLEVALTPCSLCQRRIPNIKWSDFIHIHIHIRKTTVSTRTNLMGITTTFTQRRHSHFIEKSLAYRQQSPVERALKTHMNVRSCPTQLTNIESSQVWDTSCIITAY